jgi:hypothetical protein
MSFNTPRMYGRHPGPHEGHELAKKLIILKYGQNLIVLVDLADILVGPHEGHELAKKLIIVRKVP